MLLAVSPALEWVLGPRLDHPAARALLVRYPTPTALRAAGRRRLGPLAKRHAPRMGARPVDEIQAALGAQTVTVPAEETAGRVIRDLAEELDRLAARRDRFATEIEQIFTSHPRAPVLMSSRGLGPGPALPLSAHQLGRVGGPHQPSMGGGLPEPVHVRRMVRLSGPTPNRALAKSQPHHQASQSPGDQLLREAALKPSGDARLRQPRINDRASEPAATASSRGAAAQPIDRQAATDRG
jgi:hypothetical protein